MSKKESLYLINYKDPNENKTLSLKARKIADSPLGLGFIYISDFVFENKDGILIQPEQERLEKILQDTTSLHLPMYSILSVQELSPSSHLKLSKQRMNLVSIHKGH